MLVDTCWDMIQSAEHIWNVIEEFDLNFIRTKIRLLIISIDLVTQFCIHFVSQYLKICRKLSQKNVLYTQICYVNVVQKNRSLSLIFLKLGERKHFRTTPIDLGNAKLGFCTKP